MNAIQFSDETRLVLPHIMFWVAPSSKGSPTPWSIKDTDGGEEFFQKKADAVARLARYAAEEGK